MTPSVFFNEFTINLQLYFSYKSIKLSIPTSDNIIYFCKVVKPMGAGINFFSNSAEMYFNVSFNGLLRII